MVRIVGWTIAGLPSISPIRERASRYWGISEPTDSMFRKSIGRAWHLAVTFGPIFAIALTQVAARRWS
jgi:hypothetical protein